MLGAVAAGTLAGALAATGQLGRVARTALWAVIVLAAGPEFLRLLFRALAIMAPLAFAWGILQALAEERSR